MSTKQNESGTPGHSDRGSPQRLRGTKGAADRLALSAAGIHDGPLPVYLSATVPDVVLRVLFLLAARRLTATACRHDQDVRGSQYGMATLFFTITPSVATFSAFFCCCEGFPTIRAIGAGLLKHGKFSAHTILDLPYSFFSDLPYSSFWTYPIVIFFFPPLSPSFMSSFSFLCCASSCADGSCICNAHFYM